MNNTKHSNVQSVFRLGEQWTPCSRWEDLPSGEWLVKIDNPSFPYHVVVVDDTHVHFNEIEISIVKSGVSSGIVTLYNIQAYHVIPEYYPDMYNQYTDNEEMFNYEKDILPWEDGTLGQSLEHAEVCYDSMNTLTKIRIESYIQKMEKNLEEFRRFVEEIKTTSEEISK